MITAPMCGGLPAGDAVSAIVDKLENGRHVILTFGEHDSDLDYLLVSNILTRRIRQHWVQKTEKHKTHNDPARGRCSLPSKRPTNCSTRASPARPPLVSSPASCANISSPCWW